MTLEDPNYEGIPQRARNVDTIWSGPDYTLLDWLTNLSSRTNFILLWMIYINKYCRIKSIKEQNS